jgi:RNA polymerase sigma-70 factor, ECF subfamily
MGESGNNSSFSSPQDLSDEDLAVLAVKDGAFFTPLVSRYKEKFFYYLKSFTGFGSDEAEDVVQASFIKIYLNLNGFDRKLKFSSWAYRIVHNEAIDEMRRQKRRPVLDISELSIPDKTSLAEELDIKFEKEKVAAVLSSMKSDYREVLALRFFEHREYKEISDILKRPLGSVCTMIARAKKTFKDKYERYA